MPFLMERLSEDLFSASFKIDVRMQVQVFQSNIIFMTSRGSLAMRLAEEHDKEQPIDVLYILVKLRSIVDIFTINIIIYVNLTFFRFTLDLLTTGAHKIQPLWTGFKVFY